MKKGTFALLQDVDFYLIGIVCKLKPVEFVWRLNQLDEFDFWCSNDFEMHHENSNLIFHVTNYKSIDEENHLNWLLVFNRDVTDAFPKQLKQFDFLLLVRGGTEFLNLKEILLKIRNIKRVYAASDIDNEKIKQSLAWLV